MSLQAVNEVLQVLGQDGRQAVPCPSWHYQEPGGEAHPSDRQLPLREALIRCYDLRSAYIGASA